MPTTTEHNTTRKSTYIYMDDRKVTKADLIIVHPETFEPINSTYDHSAKNGRH